MRIAEFKTVGAMAAPRGQAPFDRATVVVRSDVNPTELVQVRAYVGDIDFEGPRLSHADWVALTRSESAIDLEPIDLVRGAAVWILRNSFHRREAALEALRSSGYLVRDIMRLKDGGVACLVREPEANVLRDKWAEEAEGEALSWAKSGNWERARQSATRAFVVDRAMNPEHIAILMLTNERLDNTVRSTGYLEMARRSRGDDFVAEIADKRRALDEHLRSLLRPYRTSSASEIRAASDRLMREGLEQLGTAA